MDFVLLVGIRPKSGFKVTRFTCKQEKAAQISWLPPEKVADVGFNRFINAFVGSSTVTPYCLFVLLFIAFF
jgi:hypothetical protein